MNNRTVRRRSAGGGDNLGGSYLDQKEAQEGWVSRPPLWARLGQSRQGAIVDVVNLSGVYGGFDGGECGISRMTIRLTRWSARSPTAASVRRCGRQRKRRHGAQPRSDRGQRAHGLRRAAGRSQPAHVLACRRRRQPGLLLQLLGPNVDIAAPRRVCELDRPRIRLRAAEHGGAAHIAGAAALYKAGPPISDRSQAALLAARRERRLRRTSAT